MKRLIFNIAWSFYDWCDEQKMKVMLFWRYELELFFRIPYCVLQIPGEVWSEVKQAARDSRISRCEFILRCIKNGIEIWRLAREPGAKLILKDKDERGHERERELVLFH